MDQMTAPNCAMPSPSNDQDNGSLDKNHQQEFKTGHQCPEKTGRFDPTLQESDIDPSLDNIITTHHRSSETPSQGFTMSQGGTNIGYTRGASILSFAPPPRDRRSHGASAMTVLQSTMPRPNSKKAYLNGFPSYAYIMPTGPALNFTMVDIIVILPNWFSNQQIMNRFMNNGLTPIVHVAILQEHRTMDNMSVSDIIKLREGCSDEYRRVMRTIDPAWKRASHTVPATWNHRNMTVNHILPDAARHPSYAALKAIPFKDLMIGIKKLPQGEDAGDLTRALDFALRHQKIDANGLDVEYMFPDDIHAILNHIGSTTLTEDHFDMVTRFRYDRKQKDATAAKRKRELETESPPLQPHLPKRQQRSYSGTPDCSFIPAQMEDAMGASYSDYGGEHTHQLAPPQAFGSSMYGYETANVLHAPSAFNRLPSPTSSNAQHELPSNWVLQGQDTSPAPGYHHHHLPGTAASFDALAVTSTPPQVVSVRVASANNVIDLTNDGFPDLPDCTRMPPDVEASVAAARAGAAPEGVEDDIFGLKDIDALMAAHNNFLIPEDFDIVAVYEYIRDAERAPEQLLWTCFEADDLADNSQLATAARWCRDPENYASQYTVADLDLVTLLQGVAAREDDPQDDLDGMRGGMDEDEEKIWSDKEFRDISE